MLVPRALGLARAAAKAGIGFNIDAEEAERLDLSLDVIAAMLARSGPEGLGRLRGGGAGLWPAGRRGDRLAGRPGGASRPADHGAAGEGRLLGRRDQGGAGARPARLSGLHPQGLDRCELHGQCAQAAGRARPAFIRNSPPTMRIPSRRCSRWRAIATASSSSGFTAWARRCTGSCTRPRGRAAAFMRPSGRIAICWPIWCAGCWRTAPIRPSSTRSLTESLPAEEIAADPGGRGRGAGGDPQSDHRQPRGGLRAAAQRHRLQRQRAGVGIATDRGARGLARPRLGGGGHARAQSGAAGRNRRADPRGGAGRGGGGAGGGRDRIRRAGRRRRRRNGRRRCAVRRISTRRTRRN